MKYPIITIGREYGSGGREIARELAKALSIPFYDKELVQMSAKETGLAEEFIEQSEQHPTLSFLYSLSFSSQNLPVSDQVFIAESQVIQRVASEGPCVLVGRCADYVLRGRGDCLRIFVHAPLEERIRRVREDYGAKDRDLRARVLKTDRNRAAYYNHFTSGNWGKAQNYDLSFNSGLGVHTAVRLLLQLVQNEEVSR